jgi:hypothetical protein
MSSVYSVSEELKYLREVLEQGSEHFKCDKTVPYLAKTNQTFSARESMYLVQWTVNPFSKYHFEGE